MNGMPAAASALVVVVLALFAAAEGHDNRVLTIVKPGVAAGGISYTKYDAPRTRRGRSHRTSPEAGRRLLSYEGERMYGQDLGEYDISVLVGGQAISAVIDTGSDICHVAGPGIKGAKAFTPANSSPAPVQQTASSAACNAVCQSAYSCPQSKAQCIYNIEYQGGDGSQGVVYEGSLTFPNSKLAALNPFILGVDTVVNPPKGESTDFDNSTTNAIFGMSWAPVSLWTQLKTANLVGDTMFLCLGNGGDGFKAQQGGVLVLGSDNSVSLPYTPTEVVTATMVSTAALNKAQLVPLSMWVTLQALSIPASSGAGYGGSGAIAVAGNVPYLLDTGTSYVYLATKDFKAFDTAFRAMLNANKAVKKFRVNKYSGYIITLTATYSYAQLNQMFPVLAFTFAGSSGPLNIYPSTYMIFQEADSDYQETGHDYITPILSNQDNTQGILGNVFFANMLIQQHASSLAITFTSVNSCADVIY